MKQKEMARWLKLVTVLAAAAGVFLVAVLIPALLDRLIPEDSCAAILWLPLVGFCWLTAAPCFACLFQFWGFARGSVRIVHFAAKMPQLSSGSANSCSRTALAILF